MHTFIISQIIGLLLFCTVNYGALSYIKYRKNQVDSKPEQKVERFFLQQARMAIYLFFVAGIAYKINGVQSQLTLDFASLSLHSLISSLNTLVSL